MHLDESLVAIGRRVSAARKRAGIDTRQELSRRLRERGLPRMGPETVGKIERGQRAFNDYEIQPFADALGVTREFFFEDSAGETQLDRIESGIYDNRSRLEAIIVTLRDEIAELGRQVAEIRAVAIERVGADVLGAGTTEEPSATGEEAERTDRRQ